MRRPKAKRCLEKSGVLLNMILLLCLTAIGFAALWCYRLGPGGRFSTRVNSLTTMDQVQHAVGQPVRVSTNNDGSVTWDYTHLWSATAKIYFESNGVVHRIFTE